MSKTAKTPPLQPVARQHECSGCLVRQEMIEFLRDQLRTAQQMNDQLQNKLLALTGDAADRYQKLRVMELASTNAPAMSGVISMSGADAHEPDEFDTFIDALQGGLAGGGKN